MAEMTSQEGYEKRRAEKREKALNARIAELEDHIRKSPIVAQSAPAPEPDDDLNDYSGYGEPQQQMPMPAQGAVDPALVDAIAGLEDYNLSAEQKAMKLQQALMGQQQRQQVAQAAQAQQAALVQQLQAQHPALNDPESDLVKICDEIWVSDPGLQQSPLGIAHAVTAADNILKAHNQQLGLQETQENQARAAGSLATGGHDVVVEGSSGAPSAERLNKQLAKARANGTVDKFFLENASIFIPKAPGGGGIRMTWEPCPFTREEIRDARNRIAAIEPEHRRLLKSSRAAHYWSKFELGNHLITQDDWRKEEREHRDRLLAEGVEIDDVMVYVTDSAYAAQREHTETATREATDGL